MKQAIIQATRNYDKERKRIITGRPLCKVAL